VSLPPPPGCTSPQQPIGEDDPLEHAIHKEYGVLSAEVAEQLSQARAVGRRIIAVGTTTARLVPRRLDKPLYPARLPVPDG